MARNNCVGNNRSAICPPTKGAIIHPSHKQPYIAEISLPAKPSLSKCAPSAVVQDPHMAYCRNIIIPKRVFKSPIIIIPS